MRGLCVRLVVVCGQGLVKDALRTIRYGLTLEQ
jgi:hypothetical protein